MRGFLIKHDKAVRITGYIILSVSCVLFLLIPVMPLTGMKAARVAAASAGLFIAGEILFYLSLVFLGKSFLEKIKTWFRFRKSKAGSSGISKDNG